MACDYDQNILKQGNVISINLKDVHSEYNLLGFHNNKSVFEYTDEKLNTEQQQKDQGNLKKIVDSTVVSKQIIVKSISSSGRIVLINDKKVVPVKKCTYVPINTLKIISDKKSATAGNLTKVNTMNSGYLTLTKGTRTYEKKKDKTYQNANTDNRISKINKDLKACNMIKEIGDKCTSISDNVIPEVSKGEKPFESKLDGKVAQITIDGINHKLKLVPSKHITCLQNATKNGKAIDQTNKQDSNTESISKTLVNTKPMCIKTYCKKSPVLEKNDTGLLNDNFQISATIDLTSDINNETEHNETICEGKVITLTESDACKEDKKVKVNDEQTIWNPKDNLNLGCADMGKIKHFKEKSSTETSSTANPKTCPDSTVKALEGRYWSTYSGQYEKKMTVDNAETKPSGKHSSDELEMEVATPQMQLPQRSSLPCEDDSVWSSLLIKKMIVDDDNGCTNNVRLNTKSIDMSNNDEPIQKLYLYSKNLKMSQLPSSSSKDIIVARAEMPDDSTDFVLPCRRNIIKIRNYDDVCYRCHDDSNDNVKSYSKNLKISRLPSSSSKDRLVAQPEMAGVCTDFVLPSQRNIIKIKNHDEDGCYRCHDDSNDNMKLYKILPLKLESARVEYEDKTEQRESERREAEEKIEVNKTVTDKRNNNTSTMKNDKTKSTKAVNNNINENGSDDKETSVSNSTSNLNVNGDNLSQRVRNTRQQRAKIINKQLSLRREIEKIIKGTIGPRKKHKRKNHEEKAFKHSSCQTTVELSDSATQTEGEEQQHWPHVPVDTALDMNNLDVILEEHLDCKSNIIGNNVNFGVGPKMKPYVVNSGGTVTCTAGNNLDVVVSDSMNIFPSQLDPTMGYVNVNNINSADFRGVSHKQYFFDYLKNCCQQDAAGNLPLHLAVLNNNLYEVRKQALMLKLRNIPIDFPNSNELTPLHIAIIHNSDETIIRYLLHTGADLSCMDSDGNTPMHLAVYHNSLTALKELLQKANETRFNLNTFNYEGFTPLLLATVENKYEMVAILLHYGADANVTDQKSGRTPLFHAVENNNLDMVQLLLDSGANKKIKNFSGTSTHDAVFELENINPEIKNKIIGRDIFTVNSTRTDKRRKNTEKTKEDVCTKKLKTVKTYRKIKDMCKN